MRMIFIFLLSVSTITAFCQKVIMQPRDTLTYKGVILSSWQNLVLREDGIPIGMNHNGYMNYWVPVDTSMDYYSSMANGIYFTDEYWGDDLKLPSFFNGYMINSKKDRTTTFHCGAEPKEGIFSSDYYTNLSRIAISPLWEKNYGMGSMGFYVFFVEFRYVLFGPVKFATANIHAKHEKQAYVRYATNAYFITDVISLKLIKYDYHQLKIPHVPNYMPLSRYRESN